MLYARRVADTAALLFIVFAIHQPASAAVNCSDYSSSPWSCANSNTCFYCASARACLETTLKSTCDGYLDLCSTWNSNPTDCSSYFYTTTLGIVSWSSFCSVFPTSFSPSQASTGASSTLVPLCAGCQFCFSTQQCLTPSNYAASCAPWAGWCSFFDGSRDSCNLAQAPSNSLLYSSCPSHIYPRGCGPCSFCASTRRCMATVDISASNCCGFSGNCSVWNGDSKSCTRYILQGSSWSYCYGGNCSCFYESLTSSCSRVTERCQTFGYQGSYSCVNYGQCTFGISNSSCICAYCGSTQTCLSPAKASTQCSGWTDPCNSFDGTSSYSCMSNIRCVFCVNGKCQPRTSLASAGSTCDVNCTMHNNDLSMCIQAGCNYCWLSGICVPGTNLSCKNKCSDFNYYSQACEVSGCSYCSYGRCMSSAFACDVCSEYSYSVYTCNAQVYNLTSRNFIYNPCPAGANCTACGFCLGLDLCLRVDRLSSASCPGFTGLCDIWRNTGRSSCNGFKSMNCTYCEPNNLCLEQTDPMVTSGNCSGCLAYSGLSYRSTCTSYFHLASSGSMSQTCQSSSYKCDKCVYCNSTGLCVGMSFATAQCPFFTSNCSALDGQPTMCGRYYFDSYYGWRQATSLNQVECGYCAFTGRCLRRSHLESSCPGVGNCSFLNDGGSYDCNNRQQQSDGSWSSGCYSPPCVACIYCSALSSCILRSSVSMYCPAYSNCSVYDNNYWTCNSFSVPGDGQCAYCSSSGLCLPFSRVASICRGWASNCSMWNGFGDYYCNVHGRTAGLCAYCANTSTCIPRAGYLASCPRTTSLCSAWSSSSYCTIDRSDLAPLYCVWCRLSQSCTANTTSTCVIRCIDRTSQSLCTAGGCSWCSQYSYCAEREAVCDPCSSQLSYSEHPTSCNNYFYNFVSMGFNYMSCSGSNCSQCAYCNSTRQCASLSLLSAAVCPGWSGNCSAWNSQQYYCTTNYYTKQTCSYCTATQACKSPAEFAATPCPVECSSFNYYYSGCTSNGCIYCSYGANSSKCFPNNETGRSYCEPCSAYNGNAYSCNSMVFDWTYESFYSTCQRGNCTGCGYCGSTRNCFRNTSLSERCPGWSSPCDSWNTGYIYDAESYCAAQRGVSCSYCPSPNSSNPNRYCWPTSSPTLAASCALNSCSSRYSGSSCAALGYCTFCQSVCIPSTARCHPCVQYSRYGASYCSNSMYRDANRLSLRCSFCLATQECLPLDVNSMTTYSCAGWVDVCSGFDHDAEDCNFFSGNREGYLRVPGCGYCHATRKCLNLTKLNASSCSSHMDICSVWGNASFNCISSVYQKTLKYWDEPPCIAGACVYCGFCEKRQACMTVPNIQSTCGPWAGPCSAVPAGECFGNETFYYNPPAAIIEPCVGPCCNTICKPCATSGLCNTVRAGDPDSCSLAALVGAADSGPLAPSSAAGSGAVIGIVVGIVVVLGIGGAVAYTRMNKQGTGMTAKDVEMGTPGNLAMMMHQEASGIPAPPPPFSEMQQVQYQPPSYPPPTQHMPAPPQPIPQHQQPHRDFDVDDDL
jgi:hypothetical protein